MKGDFFMSKTTKLKKTVYTALIIAIVLVLRSFSYMISFGGGAGLRLSLAGFFTALPALLFGPFYGGLSYGIVDILGYLIKPEGAYIFPITLSEILRGVLIGFSYKLIKNINPSKIRGFFLFLSVILGSFGIFNHIMINLYPSAHISELLIGLGKRTSFFTVGLEAIAIVSIVLFAIDYISNKLMKSKHSNDSIKILTVLFICNIIATTINTVILMMFIPSLSKLGFIVFYIPRLIEEIIITVLQSFVTGYLLRLYKKLA